MHRWSVCCLLLAACAGHAGPSVALYERGDYAGAARAADTGLAAHPHDDGLWQMKIRAALALGDAAEVARAYEAHRAQRGEDDRALARELAIATLQQGLASPAVATKIAAIEAVEAAEIHALADAVAQRLADDDDRVVATAAIAVLRGDPTAPRAAGEMLQSEDAEARRIAVDGLGRKVGTYALADLEAAGADRDPRVRRAAFRWLGQLKDVDAIDLLARHLRDPDEAARAAAATALARIGGGNLAAFATTATADRALAVRLAGIELWVAAKRPEQLAQLANDEDPLVALEAAIASRGDAAKALERAATAPAWTTRAGAANIAVRAIGKPGAIALARRLLADAEPSVRLAAARVLAQGDARDRSDAITTFAAALDREELAVQAASALVSLDDPRGIAALDRLVRSAAPDQRVEAARAHRWITPGLIAALADASDAVRVAAAATLALKTRS